MFFPLPESLNHSLCKDLLVNYSLKPGFHMIVWIVRIVPVVSKNVQTIGTIIWKRYPDDRKRPGSLQNLHDRPDRPDRTQFYPSDRGRLSWTFFWDDWDDPDDRDDHMETRLYKTIFWSPVREYWGKYRSIERPSIIIWSIYHDVKDWMDKFLATFILLHLYSTVKLLLLPLQHS